MKRIYSPFHMNSFLEKVYQDVLCATCEDHTYEFSFKDSTYVILLEKYKFNFHDVKNRKDIFVITFGIKECGSDDEGEVIVQLDQACCFDNPLEVIIQCASLIEHFYINQLEAVGAF